MRDNQSNWQSPDQNDEIENHRLGRELYQRDQERNRPNQRDQNNRWDVSNNFHTGYNNQSRSHFPEDTHQRTSNIDGKGDIHRHYGNREYSVYRNPNSLNYGDGRGDRSQQQQQPFQGGYSNYGDGRGNYNARRDSYEGASNRTHSENIDPRRYQDDTNEKYYHGGYMDSRGVNRELPRPDSNPYNELPGSRSRYKDDDYRYGSGNHTWYQEQRYTANDGRVMDRDRGSIWEDMAEGARELWHDVKHGTENIFNRNRDHHDNRRHDNTHDRNHEYRSNREDRGYERGPRWADESNDGDGNRF